MTNTTVVLRVAAAAAALALLAACGVKGDPTAAAPLWGSPDRTAPVEPRALSDQPFSDYEEPPIFNEEPSDAADDDGDASTTDDMAG